MVSIAITSLTTVFGLTYFVYSNFLQDKNSRLWFVPLLKPKKSYRKRYLCILKRLLVWLDEHLSKPWSWRSWSWSLVIAYVYPIAFALLAWLFSNQPLVLAGKEVLAASNSSYRIVIVFYLSVCLFITLNLKKIGDFIDFYLKKTFSISRWVGSILIFVFFYLLIYHEFSIWLSIIGSTGWAIGVFFSGIGKVVSYFLLYSLAFLILRDSSIAATIFTLFALIFLWNKVFNKENLSITSTAVYATTFAATFVGVVIGVALFLSKLSRNLFNEVNLVNEVSLATAISILIIFVCFFGLFFNFIIMKIEKFTEFRWKSSGLPHGLSLGFSVGIFAATGLIVNDLLVFEIIFYYFYYFDFQTLRIFRSLSVDYIAPSSAVMAFFYIALPFSNSLGDFASLSISRCLSRHIVHIFTGTKPHFQRSQRGWIITGYLLLDLGLAIVFLLALAIFLPLASDFVNFLYGQNIIDWSSFVKATWQDPWGAGFFVTAMLLSTVVPTIAHLFIAFVALLLHLYHGKWLDDLASSLKSEDFATFPKQLIWWEALRLVSIVFICFFIFTGLFFAFQRLLVYVYRPVWNYVYHVAQWADGLF